MWEEERKGEEDLVRRGRGGIVYLITFIFLLYIERSHSSLRYLYVYRNTQEPRHLTSNKTLLIRTWKNWPVLITGYPAKPSFE